MTTEFIQRHRAGVLALAFLIVSTLLMALRLEPYVVGIKSTIWFFLSPTVVTTGRFFEKLDSLRGRLFRLVRVEAENTLLRDQIATMSKRDMERDMLEVENNRLRDLLNLKQQQFSEGVPAEVVGRDIRDWFNAIIINKGHLDGLTPSAAVVVGSSFQPALVGRLEETADHTSKVLLITDLLSSVSVGIVGKPDLGLLEGRNNPSCVIRYLPRDSQVVEGDEVVTAGLGGVFPPGVPVGRVTQVSYSEEGFFKLARVRPAANFGSLQEVLVIQRKWVLDSGIHPK